MVCDIFSYFLFFITYNCTVFRLLCKVIYVYDMTLYMIDMLYDISWQTSLYIKHVKVSVRVHQKIFFLIIELSPIPFCSNGQEMLSVKKEHFSINI